MSTMTMIEDEAGKVTWECSQCLAIVKDKKGFEDKMKVCPKCGAEIAEFLSIYDENGD